jgi:hypothetical protein
MRTNDLSEKMTINELSEEDLGSISGGDLQDKVNALVKDTANAVGGMLQPAFGFLVQLVNAVK